MTVATPRVSVAIPVLDEEAVIPELLRRVVAVLDVLPGTGHEVVFVDDGSRDGTWALLRQAAGSDARLCAVRLSRNFGHQIALTAALDHVSGDVTVVMDGDLQDEPEVILALLAEHAKGFDVVCAYRRTRTEGPLLRLAYYLFYRLYRGLAPIRPPLDSGDFALLSRRVVVELRRSRERHRFLRGLRTWVGFAQTGIAVDRAARRSGRSKYTVRRLVHLAFDGIFAFSVAPLRAAVVVGVIAIVAAMGFSLFALYAKLVLHRSPQGFTAVVLLMTFLAGVQLLFMGTIGEYVGRIYEEVKQRPLYVVSARLGVEPGRDG